MQKLRSRNWCVKNLVLLVVCGDPAEAHGWARRARIGCIISSIAIFILFPSPLTWLWPLWKVAATFRLPAVRARHSVEEKVRRSP